MTLEALGSEVAKGIVHPIVQPIVAGPALHAVGTHAFTSMLQGISNTREAIDYDAGTHQRHMLDRQ